MNACRPVLRLALRAAALVATTACSFLSLAMVQAAAPAAKSEYLPKQYEPRSLRDFTGLWVNKDGIGWVPGKIGLKGEPPLTPDYAAIYARHRKNAAEGRPTGDPTAACLPQGMPRIMTMVYPMEIMQNDIQLNIFAEWNEQTRRIFIDGRPHPPADELDPTYYGHSIGRWEGNVLVAETVGLRDDTNLEATGIPHSSELVVHERIWLADKNTLKDEITLVDAKAYTKPWLVTKTYHRAEAGFSLLPYVCLENNRNPINANGEIGVILEDGGR
jgi:hypothetical protein